MSLLTEAPEGVLDPPGCLMAKPSPRRPHGALSGPCTAVLMALIRAHADTGRCTLRGLALELDKSPGTVRTHLNTLRSAGLITWEDGRAGTIRPTCEARPLERP